MIPMSLRRRRRLRRVHRGCASGASIGQVKTNPGRYVDKNVTVHGTVTSSWGIPLVPFKMYQVDDGTGEILVRQRRRSHPVEGRTREGHRQSRRSSPCSAAARSACTCAKATSITTDADAHGVVTSPGVLARMRREAHPEAAADHRGLFFEARRTRMRRHRRSRRRIVPSRGISVPPWLRRRPSRSSVASRACEIRYNLRLWKPSNTPPRSSKPSTRCSRRSASTSPIISSSARSSS